MTSAERQGCSKLGVLFSCCTVLSSSSDVSTVERNKSTSSSLELPSHISQLRAERYVQSSPAPYRAWYAASYYHRPEASVPTSNTIHTVYHRNASLTLILPQSLTGSEQSTVHLRCMLIAETSSVSRKTTPNHVCLLLKTTLAMQITCHLLYIAQ